MTNSLTDWAKWIVRIQVKIKVVHAYLTKSILATKIFIFWISFQWFIFIIFFLFFRKKAWKMFLIHLITNILHFALVTKKGLFTKFFKNLLIVNKSLEVIFEDPLEYPKKLVGFFNLDFFTEGVDQRENYFFIFDMSKNWNVHQIFHLQLTQTVPNLQRNHLSSYLFPNLIQMIVGLF